MVRGINRASARKSNHNARNSWTRRPRTHQLQSRTYCFLAAGGDPDSRVRLSVFVGNAPRSGVFVLQYSNTWNARTGREPDLSRHQVRFRNCPMLGQALGQTFWGHTSAFLAPTRRHRLSYNHRSAMAKTYLVLSQRISNKNRDGMRGDANGRCTLARR